MNNENKPSVIAELTAALASMAERAAAAEAEAEQYKKSSGEWYQFFTSKDKELRDTQAEGYDQTDLYHFPSATFPTTDCGLLGSVCTDGIGFLPSFLPRPLGECLL